MSGKGTRNTTLQAALRDEATDVTDDSRVAALRAMCHDHWDAFGDLMAVRMMRSAQVAFLAGAYGAAAVCAVAAARHHIGAELAGLSDGEQSPRCDMPFSGLIDTLDDYRGISWVRGIDLRGLAAVEARYFSWNAPFSDNAIETQLHPDGVETLAAAAQRWDAPDVMYRDAAFALDAVLKLLSPTSGQGGL
jgi:hypothetical protein